MPSKYPLCRRKYIRSGGNEKHLRTAPANLDIVLASTVGDPSSRDIINDMETSILHHPEAIELQDSDYESDPDPTGDELDAFTSHESDTEIPDDSTSSLPGRQKNYLRNREAVGDVDGFEQENCNLCEDPWAPFSSAQGFKLAPWFIQSKLPKSRINEYLSCGLSSSGLVGYRSMHTLENHLPSLDPHSSYRQGFEGQVKDSKRTMPFFYRNVLDCVRYLLRQIAYQDDLVYTSRCEFNPNGERNMQKCTPRTGGGIFKYSALTSFTVTLAYSL